MKKILVLILGIILWLQIIFTISYAASNSCGNFWNDISSTDVSSMLKDCQPDGTLEWKNKKELFNLWWLISVSVSSNEWYEIENAQWKILSIQEKLVLLASILAIWWLVYAWIMFVTSYWDDAKHKKWKDAIKWSIIGFIVAIIAMQLINAVINLLYWISNK